MRWSATVNGKEIAVYAATMKEARRKIRDKVGASAEIGPVLPR